MARPKSTDENQSDYDSSRFRQLSRKLLICDLTKKFGIKVSLSTAFPVIGETLFVDSHSTSAALSYVWPSEAMVGSIITSKLLLRRSMRHISRRLGTAYWHYSR